MSIFVLNCIKRAPDCPPPSRQVSQRDLCPNASHKEEKPPNTSSNTKLQSIFQKAVLALSQAKKIIAPPRNFFVRRKREKEPDRPAPPSNSNSFIGELPHQTTISLSEKIRKCILNKGKGESQSSIFPETFQIEEEPNPMFQRVTRIKI